MFFNGNVNFRRFLDLCLSIDTSHVSWSVFLSYAFYTTTDGIYLGYLSIVSTRFKNLQSLLAYIIYTTKLKQRYNLHFYLKPLSLKCHQDNSGVTLTDIWNELTQHSRSNLFISIPRQAFSTIPTTSLFSWHRAQNI